MAFNITRLVQIFQLSLLLISLSNGNTQNNDIFQVTWQHKWQCNGKNGECLRIKVENSQSTTSSPYYETQNICRLICGKHGPLWPRPTGSTVINPTLTSVDPREIKFFTDEHTPEVMEYLGIIEKIFLDNILMEGKKFKEFDTAENKLIVRYVLNNSDNMTLNWDTNESYTLEMTTNGNIIVYLITELRS